MSLLWLCVVAGVAAVWGHGDEGPQGNWAASPYRESSRGERPQDGGKANDHNIQIIDFRMPGVHPDKEDAYICTGLRVKDPDREQYITSFEAQATANIAHHMILFGCEEPARDEETWQCGATCGGSVGSKIMYAWARNAPPTHLPKDVGFRIGGRSQIKWLVLQIHYLHSFSNNQDVDTSGVRLTIDPTEQTYIGGIYLMYSNYFIIPPDTKNVSSDISCEYKGNAPLYPFAFRVHTHTLGRVVTGYVNNGTWYLMGKGNPQWPQAFYPMSEKYIVKKGDILAGMCTYDSSGRQRQTYIGATHNDEMCNFYMMYYTDADEGDTYYGCGGSALPREQFPAEASVPLPPNPRLEGIASGHIHSGGVQAVKSWPQITESDDVTLGQVAGVAVDSKGNIHVFHRGTTKWDGLSFDVRNRFNDISDGPITVPTLLVFNPSGKIIKKWGANRFYMPHGLHIDQEDNIWVTDVAMHQVMKFPGVDTDPILTLGKKFEPGSDDDSFCKPSDVTVLESGEFFVTDGYCNSRVMKFSKSGKLLLKWGSKSKDVADDGYPDPGTFDLPHSITLLPEKKLVCVADRENGRIQCFDLTGKFIRQINAPEFQGVVFAVSYSKARGELYAVNGPNSYGRNNAIQGFTIDPDTGKIIKTWSPKPLGFSAPHDIAVSTSGDDLYVTEIGPNKIWKFTNSEDDSHKTVKKDGVVKPIGSAPVRHRPEGSVDSADDEEEDVLLEEDVGDFGASLIIGALLIIPVIIIVSVTVFLRLKRNGKLRFLSGEFSHKRNRRFNLGSFFNQHKGFDRVRNEDSDELDHLNSDSEVEEYSATSNLKA